MTQINKSIMPWPNPAIMVGSIKCILCNRELNSWYGGDGNYIEVTVLGSYSSKGKRINRVDFLNMLRNTIGKIFVNYKSGKFAIYKKWNICSKCAIRIKSMGVEEFLKIVKRG